MFDAEIDTDFSGILDLVYLFDHKQSVVRKALVILLADLHFALGTA